MTNLEANKESINTESYLCIIAHVCRYRKGCSDKVCAKCEFKESVDECIKAVLEEHEEKIKLKRWEYDLIKSYTDIDEAWNGRILHECYVVRYMFYRGYFENVDLNITFREALDNCEVIDK